MNKLNWMVALAMFFPLVAFAIDEADVPGKRGRRVIVAGH